MINLLFNCTVIITLSGSSPWIQHILTHHITHLDPWSVHSALPVCLPCIHAMIYLDIDMEINIYSRTDWFCLKETGDSANAVPPTKKLRTRVTRIWGDRRGQPNRSAMERPRSGPTSFGIEVQPVPGKYALLGELISASMPNPRNLGHGENLHITLQPTTSVF